MARKLAHLTCMFLALATTCAQADRATAPASGGGSIEKSRLSRYTRSEAEYDATLAVNDRTSMLILTFTAHGANTGGHPSMSRRLEIWRPLLEQLFRERGRQREYLLTVGEYPELKRRMAEAAVCLDEWDPKTGRPLTGQAGPALRALLGREHLYAELDAFFVSVGYLVTVDHVEGVMICRWKDLGGPAARCKVSTDADSLAPCGASIIFKLTRKEDAKP
jgi:hypothetical protein